MHVNYAVREKVNWRNFWLHTCACVKRVKFIILKECKVFSLYTCKSISSTLCPLSTKRNEEAYNIGRLHNSHINIKTEEASSNAAQTQLHFHPFPNLQSHYISGIFRLRWSLTLVSLPPPLSLPYKTQVPLFLWLVTPNKEIHASNATPFKSWVKFRYKSTWMSPLPAFYPRCSKGADTSYEYLNIRLVRRAKLTL